MGLIEKLFDFVIILWMGIIGIFVNKDKMRDISKYMVFVILLDFVFMGLMIRLEFVFQRSDLKFIRNSICTVMIRFNEVWLIH